MRFYNQPHAFYCGVDLHARSRFTHVLDRDGATMFAKVPVRHRLDLTRLDWPPRRGPRFSLTLEFCRGCPGAEPTPN